MVHTIEILPNEIYRLNEDYVSWESKMFDRFVMLYPTENICFISDDVLVGIENAIYIKEGLDYAPFSTNKGAFTFDSCLLQVYQNVLHGIGEVPCIVEEEKYPVPFKNIGVEERYSNSYQKHPLAA